MSDLKGAGFGLVNLKKENTEVKFDYSTERNPKSHRDWTYLEVRVPREMEQELYDLVLAKIKEKGFNHE